MDIIILRVTDHNNVPIITVSSLKLSITWSATVQIRLGLFKAGTSDVSVFHSFQPIGCPSAFDCVRAKFNAFRNQCVKHVTTRLAIAKSILTVTLL